MKVVGLVVEYNPFHNGHLYHLEQSRSLSGADCVVCVMSGNFIQRGEPALVNKWARAKSALLSGADLVVELPMVFAMSSAEYFAYGAVKILDSLGVVDYICFGSESGKIDTLDLLAEVLVNEPESYKAVLKDRLNSGSSFPASREAALEHYLENKNWPGNSSDILGSSNNILAIEYLKALKKLKSSIIPLTIKRLGNSYNSENLTGSISSATSIRKLISTGKADDIENTLGQTVPPASLSILKKEFDEGRGPVFSNDFSNLILHEIRKMPSEKLKKFPYISEGLENRIKSSADNCGTLEELIDSISTKRYTRTRIQRCLFSILNGLTSEDLDEFMSNGGPQYIRVLGFNKTGRSLLSKIKKKASLPVIVKTADFKNSDNHLVKRMLELESQSTDIYVLGYKNGAFKKAGQEYTQNIIKIEG